MKKMLLVTASFFSLGMFLISPLHAMEEEKENKGIKLPKGKGRGMNTKLFPAVHKSKSEINTTLFQDRFELNLFREMPEVNPSLARVLREIEILNAALSATNHINDHPTAPHNTNATTEGLQDIFRRVAMKNGYEISGDFSYEECITSFRDAMLEEYLNPRNL
ncbi:MAG: hypothetical protein H0X26_00720 [Alphaproteobacteria bacterium]|nr:hypothetical protein [Alphaproteobacteria bacterium]